MNPTDHAHFGQHGISLLSGWFPTTIQVAAIVLLVLAIGWRTRRWRFVWLPVSLLVGAAVAGAGWWYETYAGLASDPAPVQLWLWLAVFGVALAVVVIGFRSARWWRRGLSVLAVPVALAAVLLVLDQWVGYFPTWQAAWAAVTAGPLPDQIDASDLPDLRNTVQTTGKIVPVDIPDDASGFAHRTEYVYLPPAWFAGPTPPQLPAVLMIAGEFNTPADWARSGNIVPAVDQFAAQHGGRTPILVFADAGGSFNNDTECVNGPRGDAADHLTKDVRPYVVSTFGASPDPARWAVAGWSMGGTCAIDLTVMHPELFHSFVDIAGDAGPTAGTKQQTIDRLFGGNTQSWAAFDPATVLAAHGAYSGVEGRFDDLTPPARRGNGRPGQGNWHPPTDTGATGMGGQDRAPDTGEVGAAQELCKDATAQGIACQVHTTSGGHTWQFAASSFTTELGWLTDRLYA